MTKFLTKHFFLFFFVILGLLVLLLFLIYQNKTSFNYFIQTALVPNHYTLAPDSMIEQMKKNGCVYDGLLTPRYTPRFSAGVRLVKESHCRYIHRAIETWNIPPNFQEIKKRLNIIKDNNPNILLGMFIAESINVNKRYYYPDEKRYFNFRAMCVPGSLGAWGANTCKPSLEKIEYQKYVDFITKKAIDLGIRDFTFGQIYYQDPHWDTKPMAKMIIAKIKNYARSREINVAVGAQTNDIDQESYLKNFDYITGGVGQSVEGEIQKEGPCWNYYKQKNNYCWAMLWDKKYKNKANNIFVYLDWNNDYMDDIHRFTRMSPEQRKRFLGSAYDFFLYRDIGFLMPLSATLGWKVNGCYGPTKEFYSANKEYGCKDEDNIVNIFKEQWPLPNHAKFITQDIPLQMEAGKKYPVKITFENTSFRKWRPEYGIKLGAYYPKDNMLWGLNRVNLNPQVTVRHNEQLEFIFNVVAPSKPGKYPFQWRMLKEDTEWFGQASPLLNINVVTGISGKSGL